eukprot:jgi/Undpi1/2363/HiC_scaffold_13.g05746.m1
MMRPVLQTAAFLSVLAQLTTAKDTSSPNKAISKPSCDKSIEVSVRYAGSSDRMYIESANGRTRGGCITLKQIWESREGEGPLYAVDKNGDISDTVTRRWLLTDDLYVQDGITLKVHGKSGGGDSDELRLLSTKNKYINLRAHGGSLDFVWAWDTDRNYYDKDESDGRSYISAISEVITDSKQGCSGKAKNDMGEARMDIVDSEMAYLGFQDSESYGLTWKRNPEIFDDVNVYGNIYDSEIHHNNFGVYTYGHHRGDWRRNRVHDNSGYGFDPHDDSDYLTIHDNKVFNNEWHGIIASERCNGVSIQGNEVYDGSSNSAGIFLHRSSNDAIVRDNYVHDNGDAGIALLEVSDCEISHNYVKDNRYGMRLSVGCCDNFIYDNDFVDNYKHNVLTYIGADKPVATNTGGRSQNNIFKENKFSGDGESMKIKETDGFQFLNNNFKSADKIRFYDSTETIMKGNTGLKSTEVKVTHSSCFDEKCDDGFDPMC